MAKTVMAEDEGEDLNRWGWDEGATKVQHCTYLCSGAAEVLETIASTIGVARSQIDAEALHFVAMLIDRFRREGETLVGLLERARRAMEECED
jgi:hypothetical protein